MGITIKRARGRRIAYIIALAELGNIPCVSRLICTDIVRRYSKTRMKVSEAMLKLCLLNYKTTGAPAPSESGLVFLF